MLTNLKFTKLSVNTSSELFKMRRIEEIMLFTFKIPEVLNLIVNLDVH